MSRITSAILALIVGLLTLTGTAQAGVKIVQNKGGQMFLIRSYSDGLRRDKYAVIDPTTSRPHWYADGGSANAGPGESGRHTSQKEWCRVRYLFGDDVRVPECWGSFMYSSHVIIGVDGSPYELWFSPSSVSYYKIRNQRTGIWYAHDGSANAGHPSGRTTSKKEWCYVIIVHGNGILKVPETCKKDLAQIARVTAGIASPAEETQAMKDAQAILDFHKNVAIETAGNAADMVTGSFSFNAVGVGVAVGYGTKFVKDQLGWNADPANAAEVAADTLTTTAVNGSVTTLIMMAAGSTFNPVSAGVGLLVAGAAAGGEALYKASSDTGIVLHDGYETHPRYERDLNGIADHQLPMRGLCPDTGCVFSKPLSFDTLVYIAGHGDLINAFGTDEAAGATHYFQNGFREKRDYNRFNFADYYYAYPDLQAAIGYNYRALAQHCIQHGWREGRAHCGGR